MICSLWSQTQTRCHSTGRPAWPLSVALTFGCGEAWPLDSQTHCSLYLCGRISWSSTWMFMSAMVGVFFSKQAQVSEELCVAVHAVQGFSARTSTDQRWPVHDPTHGLSVWTSDDVVLVIKSCSSVFLCYHVMHWSILSTEGVCSHSTALLRCSLPFNGSCTFCNMQSSK